ncbi:ATP-dependent (S)-NAD(P)H-hydrate dehydratase [Aphelenchoides bicaudatus]|nr:ATP-dependent (S)-NAD(P)H-hydrate dehydratase [Aphelenchoides bicaudatus]
MCSVDMASRIQKVFEIFPKLGPALKKGDCGKIAVIGGAPEYTGAPYFASLAPMKIGADLSYLFCPPEAATVIKTYSPELIVHPNQDMQSIETVINRIDSLVIGPGLGRDSKRLVPLIKNLLNRAKQDEKLGVVIDADGLFHVADCLDELKNSSRVILTPNHREFKRLYEKVFSGQQIDGITEEHVKSLASNLGVNVFCKGEKDFITDGREVLIGQEKGTDRRCGGQGDLLSGAISLFIYWEKLGGQSRQDGINSYFEWSVMCKHFYSLHFEIHI